MTDKPRKKKSGKGARPITNERDYEGAAAAAKKLIGDAQRESAAEARLQALIQEMEKFDQLDDDGDIDDAADDIYSGPRRRWSDES